MILTGREIKARHSSNDLVIEPFADSHLSTNSYDLRLGSTLIRYTDEVLDPHVAPNYEEFAIPVGGYQMKRGEFLLGSTEETIGSEHFVPIIHAKSGTARMGLFVHVTADLIDIGSVGCSTLQLYATLPVVLHAGMRIAQVSFWVPKGDIVLYSGKYQGSRGPVVSKTYEDPLETETGK